MNFRFTPFSIYNEFVRAPPRHKSRSIYTQGIPFDDLYLSTCHAPGAPGWHTQVMVHPKAQLDTRHRKWKERQDTLGRLLQQTVCSRSGLCEVTPCLRTEVPAGTEAGSARCYRGESLWLEMEHTHREFKALFPKPSGHFVLGSSARAEVCA